MTHTLLTSLNVPGAGEFHRHMIACYLKLGRRADALVVYQRCEALFHAVLGIEPSPETKSLLTEIGVKK